MHGVHRHTIHVPIVFHFVPPRPGPPAIAQALDTFLTVFSPIRPRTPVPLQRIHPSGPKRWPEAYHKRLGVPIEPND